MEDINPKDNKGQNHGYQEWYHSYHQLQLYHRLKIRVEYKHGLEIGYEEWHKIYSHSTTSFYIK